MKALKNTILLLTCITIMFTSCSKSDSSPAVVTPVATVAADGFTWTENGGTSVLTVDNPYANLQGKTIFAIRSGNTIYEINLTALAVGTYTIANGTNNVITYIPNANGFFNATSGSVIITANANNKISGTFTGTGSGNGITSVKGQFTNIPIQ